MYASIRELPSQVRASLDDRDCEVWLKTYNECAPTTDGDAAAARKKAWSACRTLPSSFSFKATGSVDAVDDQREILDVDSIKRHMDSFIEFGGPLVYDHGNYTVGVVTDWEPEVVDGRDGVAIYGNLFGGAEVYDKMRKAFIRGKNSVSVAGEADRGKYVCDTNGCYSKRNVRQILEISLCGTPSNKYAKLQWYNKNASTAVAKSSSGFHLNIDAYTVHKDYTTCPVQALVRSLENIGYEGVTAHRDGAHIPMSYDRYRRDAPHMNRHGLRAEYTGDGVMVRDEDAMIRDAFMKGVKGGWLTADGELRNPSREQFLELYGKGLMTYDYRLKRPSTYKGRN